MSDVGTGGMAGTREHPGAVYGRTRESTADGRSIAALVRELGTDSSRLVRDEIALAKAEMREKMDAYRRSTTRMAIGGSLLLAASLVVLVAVNRGLTALLAQVMDLELAVWIAPLLLAVVFGLVGWSMVRRGKEDMAAEGLVPRGTMESLREEKRWIQEEMR